ncbi:MAG: tRNA (adenosine(37)-N6)-threonylcarbamoyltransferase complex transferase subunit TsaD [Candidatus Gastranaerophilaceae bacterium]|jgi:N6-L-threonylcarbamoyladenine synthase
MIKQFKTPITEKVIEIGSGLKKDQIILATETSCDETACAVVLNGRTIISNIVATQIKTHQQYGGVVPEIAAREHVESINIVIDEALKQAGVKPQNITAFAATVGPGLVGCLLVGLNAAKTLSLVYDKPFIGVNHLNAHVCANYIDSDLKPPFLCLLISGGHTQLIKVQSYSEQKILGETLDDAVGETYDKVARLLGIPYPGGPNLDTLAKEGNKERFKLPIAKVGEFDFSFSGLKTASLRLIKEQSCCFEGSLDTTLIKDIAASFQETVSETLIKKVIKTAEKFEIKTITIAGGVAANSEIRRKIFELENKGFKIYAPLMKYCTDNASMVAAAAYFLSNTMENLDVEVFSRIK